MKGMIYQISKPTSHKKSPVSGLLLRFRQFQLSFLYLFPSRLRETC